MALAPSEPASAGEHPARFPARFTVEQFHRLCEAVLKQRLELIDGEVLQVIAKGTRHTAVVHHLITVIQAVLTSEHDPALQLRVESLLDLGPANEPEPDLALVARREDNDWEAHPTAADTALCRLRDPRLLGDRRSDAVPAPGARGSREGRRSAAETQGVCGAVDRRAAALLRAQGPCRTPRTASCRGRCGPGWRAPEGDPQAVNR
jgi:hypothetical protein